MSFLVLSLDMGQEGKEGGMRLGNCRQSNTKNKVRPYYIPPPEKYPYDPLQSILVVSSGDLRADQGKGYDHEVAVACMSFIWVTL